MHLPVIDSLSCWPRLAPRMECVTLPLIRSICSVCVSNCAELTYMCRTTTTRSTKIYSIVYDAVMQGVSLILYTPHDLPVAASSWHNKANVLITQRMMHNLYSPSGPSAFRFCRLYGNSLQFNTQYLFHLRHASQNASMNPEEETP